MDRTARVLSVADVDALAAALRRFGAEVAAALDALQGEVRRGVEWIECERRDYWASEVRKGWNRVSETRDELQRAMTYRRVADHQPACREEKAALERAKRRLHVALEKVEEVRHWTHAVQHAATELTGAARQLADWVQGELPRALVVLGRMSQALDGYVRLPAGAGDPAELLAALMVPPADHPEESDDANVRPGDAGSPAEASAEGPGGGAGGDRQPLG